MTLGILAQGLAYFRAGDTEAALQQWETYLAATPKETVSGILFNLLHHFEQSRRQTQSGSLACLKEMGFSPVTVLDVGAQDGTPPLFEVFPDAHHVMLEAVAECEPVLRQLCQTLPSAEYLIAAVSDRSGPAALKVAGDSRYSHLVAPGQERETETRPVESISLNDLCRDRGFQGPYLVKIDVDGLEIEVLRGATDLIRPDTVFLIEATINDGDPRFPRILDFLKPFGFVLHDILEPLIRPSDRALWQVDVVMVHQDSQFRRTTTFL